MTSTTLGFLADPEHNATVETSTHNRAASLFRALRGTPEDNTTDFRGAFVEFLEEMAAPTTLLWSGTHKLSRPDVAPSLSVLRAMSIYLGRPINVWSATASPAKNADKSKPAIIECPARAADCPHSCCPVVCYAFGRQVSVPSGEANKADYYRQSYNLVAFNEGGQLTFSRLKVPNREVQTPDAVQLAHNRVWSFLTNRRDLKTLRLYRNALLLQKTKRVEVFQRLLSIVAAGVWEHEADIQSTPWKTFTHIRNWWRKNKQSIARWRDDLRAAEIGDTQQHKCEWMLVSQYVMKQKPSFVQTKPCRFKQFIEIPLSHEEIAELRPKESNVRDQAMSVGVVLWVEHFQGVRALVGFEPSKGTWSEMGGRRLPHEGTEDSAKRILFKEARLDTQRLRIDWKDPFYWEGGKYLVYQGFLDRARPHPTKSMTLFHAVSAEHPDVPLSERTVQVLRGLRQKNAEAALRAQEAAINHVVDEGDESSSEPGFYPLPGRRIAPPTGQPPRPSAKGPALGSSPQHAPPPAAPPGAHLLQQSVSVSQATGHVGDRPPPSVLQREDSQSHTPVAESVADVVPADAASMGSETSASSGHAHHKHVPHTSSSAALTTALCKEIAHPVAGQPELRDLLARFEDLAPDRLKELREELAKLRQLLDWKAPSHLLQRDIWDRYVKMPTLVQQPVFEGTAKDIDTILKKHNQLNVVLADAPDENSRKKRRLLGIEENPEWPKDSESEPRFRKTWMVDVAIEVFFRAVVALCKPHTVLFVEPFWGHENASEQTNVERLESRLGMPKKEHKKFELMTGGPRLILAPLSLGTHYVLIAVQYDGEHTAYIGVFDSLTTYDDHHKQIQNACAIMQKVLQGLYQNQKKEQAQSTALVIRAMAATPGPQQNEYDKGNVSDCGLFTCLNGLSLVRGKFPDYSLGSETAISRLRLEMNRFLLHLPYKVPKTEEYESIASLTSQPGQMADDIDVELTCLRNMLPMG